MLATSWFTSNGVLPASSWLLRRHEPRVATHIANRDTKFLYETAERCRSVPPIPSLATIVVVGVVTVVVVVVVIVIAFGPRCAKPRQTG